MDLASHDMLYERSNTNIKIMIYCFQRIVRLFGNIKITKKDFKQEINLYIEIIVVCSFHIVITRHLVNSFNSTIIKFLQQLIVKTTR